MGFKNEWIGLVAVVAIAILSVASQALATGDVVISQVWGKGNGVAANLPQASYVELFNRTANPIDMSGWSLQVTGATGGSGTPWLKVNLSDAVNPTIQPNSYFLVQVSGGTLNVVPDAAFVPTNSTLGAVGGPVGNKVVLRNTDVALEVSCPTGDPSIIDMIGFGSGANCFETSRAPGLSTSGSGLAPTRNVGGCVDTDNNGADFAAVAPSPRNSTSPQNPCLVTGACCDALAGACTIDSAASCAALGRTYSGNNTLCTPSPCGEIGRCCTALPGTCYVTTLAGCNTVNSGQWVAGLTCASAPIVCGFTDYPITTTACCFADGTCCQIDARVRSCESMGGTLPSGGGPTCQPVLGTFACGVTPPVNDLCAGALPLTLDVARVGSSVLAQRNDFCQNLCNHASFSTHGVWFSFTPAVSAQYDVGSCGCLYQSELQVLRVPDCSSPSTWSYVACSSEQGCTAGFPETGPCGSAGFAFNAKLQGVRMDAGQVYHILLSGPGPSGGTGGQSGNYRVIISASPAAAFGACCNTVTGQCELRSAAGCASSVPAAIYQGDGTACSPSLCGLDVGACCSFGGCTLRTADFCAAISATFLGGSCLPSPCVTGACCSQVGSCLAAVQFSQCQVNNGTYLGDGSTCSAVVCPQPGACCYPSGLCSSVTQTACTDPYPVLGTVGHFQGVGTACMTTMCPQPGACCDGSGACTYVIQSLCAMGSTWTSGASCMPSPCGAQGACCRGATCVIADAASCIGFASAFAGTNTICNAFGVNNTTPCCLADYNHVGGVTVQDIFDFLGAYFGQSDGANVNGVGGVTVQDIFDFLSAYFAGGC